MARKYGKNTTTKGNVLKLVKALLAIADGEIVVLGDRLKTTPHVGWIKEDELLVSGKIQQKRNNRTQTIEKGITKEDLWALVECLEGALELSQPKEGGKIDNAQRKANAIQDVLDCLKDLEILGSKPSVKTQGFWKFSLKLKHQTAGTENLKVIEQQWQVKIGAVTGETFQEASLSDETLNYRKIYPPNLTLQNELITNLFTNTYRVTPQLNEAYVPLNVVERQPFKPLSIGQQEESTEKNIFIANEPQSSDDFLIRMLKSTYDYEKIIEIIDIYLGDFHNSVVPARLQASEWLLEKILILQKKGDLKSALKTMDLYEKIDLDKETKVKYLICKGKLIAQSENKTYVLEEYINYLKNLDIFKCLDNRHELLSLYWRMSILCQKDDQPKASYYLSLHKDLSDLGEYQYAHNQWCNTFSMVFQSSVGSIQNYSLSKIQSKLVESFNSYNSMNHFLYKQKCLASVFLIIACIENLARRPIRYYKNLFQARKIYEILKVRPNHEAMPEISYLLKLMSPEAYEIVFSNNIASIIKSHSYSEVLREVYLDIEAEFMERLSPHNKSLSDYIYKAVTSHMRYF